MFYRFDKFKFFAFVDLLEAKNVFEAGLAKMPLFHFQNSIRLRAHTHTSCLQSGI